MDEARRIFANAPHLAYAASPIAACDGPDALVVITEWKEFRSPDFDDIKSRLSMPLVFDGRNVFAPELVRARGSSISASAGDERHARFSQLRDAAARRESSSSATSCWTATGSAKSSASRPRRPVPVVKIARSEERPGGAANVARNVSALGSEATLLSVVGNDEAGAALEKLSPAIACDRRCCATRRCPRPVKLRVIGRQQQLLRIDFETAPSHEVLAAKLADYER
jgi:hypothetical protein